MPLKLLLTDEEILRLPKTMLHSVTVMPNKVAKAQLKKVVELMEQKYWFRDLASYRVFRLSNEEWQSLLDEVKDAT